MVTIENILKGGCRRHGQALERTRGLCRSPIMSLAVILVIAIIMTAGMSFSGPKAQALTPRWSTYHGHQIERVLIGDDGYTLGSTDEESIFFLDEESKFIASWVREEGGLADLALADSGFQASAIYADGYTCLFEHDGEEGRQPWAYRIPDVSQGSLAISSDGSYVAVGSGNPPQEDNDEVYQPPAVLWIFDREGNQVLTREVDSTITATALGEGMRTVVGTETFTSQGEKRGKNAVIVYDARGHLIWDSSLLRPVDWVGFIGGEDGDYVAAFTEGNTLYLFDERGELLWRQTDLSQVVSDGTSLIAGVRGDTLLLWSVDGELVLERELAGHKYFALSQNRRLAIASSRRVTVLTAEGEEIGSYETEADLNSIGLSAGGNYLVIGSDRVSMFSINP